MRLVWILCSFEELGLVSESDYMKSPHVNNEACYESMRHPLGCYLTDLMSAVA